MMSKAEARKKSIDDLNNGKLLNEVEAISKALYLDKNPSRSLSSLGRNRPKSADKANVLVPSLKSKHGSDDPSAKDKKSFWNWKPLKALSHIRNRRFNCCFTLEVHTIENLPSKFNGLSLCVHWKRRDGEVLTSPIKVVEGVAEFKEKLTHACSVYGSRNGPHHSAKYEAKHFLLYAAVHDNPKFDLGKHRVDLTRLLPLTLEELEDEKSSGTWTTSFKLLGEAKGALMNVSFGYIVLGDSVAPNNKNVLQLLESKSSSRSHVRSNQGDEKGLIRRSGSLPVNHKSSATSHFVDDVKVLHEVAPVRISEFSSSVNTLYQKFDEENSESLVDEKCEISVSAEDTAPVKTAQEKIVDKSEDAEFSFIEKGKESLEEKPGLDEDDGKVVDELVGKSPDLPVVYNGAENGIQEEPEYLRDDVKIQGCDSEEKDTCTKESLLEDMESILSHVENLEKGGLDTPESKSESSDQENLIEDRLTEMPQSLNLDDLADSVADEFLSMIGIEDSPYSFGSDVEPESPRERLLREFQKEAEASGCSLFGFNIDEEEDFGDYDEEDVPDDDDDYYAPTISGWEEFSDPLPVGELEYPKIRANSLPVDESEYPKIRAKVMEDMETQALMEEWGLNEKAFQSPPPNSAGGFGSPIDLPPEEPPLLPPLGEGLGSFIRTKSGGFLRSMNPVLYRNAKSGGSLIMQVSSPVVVPAELGSGVMEILQHLASVGLEKLSMQANKLMPLEDITGKTMEQITWEAAAPHLEASTRQNLLQDEPEAAHVISSGKNRAKGTSRSQKSNRSCSSSAGDVDSEYVSLEGLAPLAMDKIEALSIEGLRIQSGMSEEEAPSNISSQSIGEFSALEGKTVSSTGSMGLEGAVGLQLLDIKDSGADAIDGLMGLSLTLDEWMKLDSGEIDEEEQMSERTSKLLAAHHANCTDLNFLRKKGDKKQGKRCGLLGNNFTVALMVQLRDPLRNYEPVGTPMLALIQVERVFLPPKPKIYSTVSQARDGGNDEDDEVELVPKEETKAEEPPMVEKTKEEQDLIPQYKISEVHVAGLKTEPGKKKMWGSAAQQQSGSRWLLANGMGKNKKQPFMKPKVGAKSSLPATVASQPGDTLWSISARFHGSGAKWKELAALNPHIRNPNVILPNETIKLR